MTLAVAVSYILVAQAKSQQPRRGIEGEKAPGWEVADWIQLPSGKESLDVANFKGKVVYLYCFQSWCPGCHRHGFPTLQKVSAHYRDNPNVAFVAIQTTFEGFETNTLANAEKVAKKYGLTVPFGQSGSPRRRSPLMRNYRTGGTPWTIVIDPEGIVRFNDFHIDAGNAIKIIDRLQ